MIPSEPQRGAVDDHRIGGVGSLATGLLAPLLLIAGCEAYPDAPFRWDSQHFDYHADRAPEDPDGLAAHFEDHFEALTTHLGVAWLPGARIDYRYLDDSDLVSRACGADDGTKPGCQRGMVVLSDRAYHPHELVHAYLDVHGRPPPVFVEGMAQVFGCDVRVRDGGRTIEPDESLEALWVEDFYPDDVDARRHNYDIAWSFVHSLVERHGTTSTVELYAALRADADVEEIDRVFRATLAESLSEASDAWRARGPRNAATLCRWIAECAAPTLDEGPVPLDSVPSVDRGDDRADAVRVTTVDEPGLYTFSVDAEEAVALTIRPCAPSRARRQALTFVHSRIPTELLVPLEAGRHWIEIVGTAGAAASVRLTRSPLADGQTCATPTALTLPIGLGRWSRGIRGDSPLCVAGTCRLWVAVSADTPLTVAVSAAMSLGAAITQICPEECGSCVSTRTSNVALSPGTPTLLELELTISTEALADAVIMLTSTTSP